MRRKPFNSPLFLALLLLAMVFLVGVLRFRYFSGYSWVDAVYMTIITITTVGFKEVQPLTDAEKLFTSLLIVSSIFIVGYAIKTFSELVLWKSNLGNFKQKRMEKQINKLSQHIIVCGYGRNGKQAVQKLQAHKCDFVVIDKQAEVFNSSESQFLYLVGPAEEDEVLQKAGIEKAQALICALPADTENLFVVLSAKQLNPNLKIISRATHESSHKKLKLAGADNVILPDKIGGDHMASLVVVPDLVEFLDNLSVSGTQDRVNVEQIPFEKVCANGVEAAISELDIRKKTGCTVIGYISPDGSYIVNPEASQVVEKNAKLIVIGKPDQIESLKAHYSV